MTEKAGKFGSRVDFWVCFEGGKSLELELVDKNAAIALTRMLEKVVDAAYSNVSGRMFSIGLGDT